MAKAPQIRKFSGEIRPWLINGDGTLTAVIPDNDDPDGNQPILASSLTTTYKPGEETPIVSRQNGSRYNQTVYVETLPGTTTVSIVLHEMPPIMLARALHGEAANADIAAGAVNADDLIVKVKNVPMLLPHRYIKSTPAPVVENGGNTLVAGTDYTIDYRRGTIVIKASGIAVGATLTISYSYEAITGTKIIGGSTPTQKFYITGDMVNRPSGEQGLMEIFEANLTSGEDVDWLSLEPLEVTLTGTLATPADQEAPYTFQVYKLAT